MSGRSGGKDLSLGLGLPAFKLPAITFKFFTFSLIGIGAGSSFIRNDEGPGMRELGGSVDKHFGPRLDNALRPFLWQSDVPVE